MNDSIRVLCCATTIAALATLGSTTLSIGVAAQELTAAEKLYADLAKLPSAEREKRILEGAKKEGTLNVIPNYRGKLMKSHAAIFEKHYTFLDTRVSDLNSYESLERVIAEERVGRHLTDASGMSVPDYTVIEDMNILARYPTPAHEKVLPKYRGFLHPDNLWIPQSISEHGISYNPNLLKAQDAPKGWFDLCDSKYKGMMSFDPGETKYLIGLYNMFDKDMDKYRQWIECIGKNDPIIMRGHTTRMTLMLAGDHAIQADNFFYRGVMAHTKNPKKNPFVPVYEAPVTIYTGAVFINKNTPHPYAAALYNDWIVSEESQQFLKDNYRGPVALSHPFMPDNAQLIVFQYETKEIAEELHDIWTKYIGNKR